MRESAEWVLLMDNGIRDGLLEGELFTTTTAESMAAHAR